ncbi:hypothetical protein WK33_07590 [Burkholderia multivorans]|nr:hypothetical protein WK33_07590 [Burkholderia multivorans]
MLACTHAATAPRWGDIIDGQPVFGHQSADLGDDSGDFLLPLCLDLFFELRALSKQFFVR